MTINLRRPSTFKGIYMNIPGLKSEAQFQNASTSAQTAQTCLAESAEPSLVWTNPCLLEKFTLFLGKQ